LPLLLWTFLAPTAQGALLGFAVPATLATVYVAPSFALIQNEVPVPMRAVAAAINLFITNIIGLGLGPFSVGFFSDVFAASTGEESLRYGLMMTGVALLWGVGHYLRCGALLKRRAEALASDP
jgi:hypothetical protein